VAFAVHNLKSSSACVGALRLADACEALEHTARGEGDPAAFARQVADVLARGRRVLSELATRFDGAGPARPASPSRAPTAAPA
jgi:hypothetical protein